MDREINNVQQEKPPRGDPMADTNSNQWQHTFRDKLRTPEEAVSTISHGQRVFVGSGAGEPQTLVEALSTRTDLSDTEIVHLLTLGVAPYVEPRFGRQFRHNAYFIGRNVRQAVSEGRADYTPIFLSELPSLFYSKRVVIDMALIQVSPPDRHGYCSYGVATDIVKAASTCARTVMAEVNEQMPRALGDCFIHVRDIDGLVHTDRPILEMTVHEPGETARKIARHVAELVEDGSTLQLGIGSIPNAVLTLLDGFKNLGIHTEMFSDGVIPMVEKGVITNAQKSIHRGKIVASFVMGSRKLYDFIDNNPFVEFHPTEYVNDPFVISQNEKMVSINAALEVDLTGQVCADSLGTTFYSGIGGQVDFMRGTARSRGGKPIIALPSTANDGTYSRIVPFLKKGAGVVTSRGDVHYVVTEYGMAFLYGKSIRERAMALIQIAHPKFRPWLLAEAKAHRLVYPDQLELPLATPTYPEELEQTLELRDGKRVFLRPLKLTDESLLREMFYKLSPDSVHSRFFRMIKTMEHEKLRDFLNVDYNADMSLVVLTGKGEDARLIAIAHYNKNPRTNFAEASFLVRDDWQGKGIGTALMAALVEASRRHGISGFTASVLADNTGMLRIFHKCGYRVESKLTGNVYDLRIPFDAKERDTHSPI